jgi:hypothetical protein
LEVIRALPNDRVRNKTKRSEGVFLTVEELAAKTLEGEHELWQALAAEVEVQMAHAHALQPLYKFKRTRAEAFKIEFVDTSLTVGRQPGKAAWTHAREFGEGTRPVFGKGSMDLAMNGYWMDGRKFNSTSEAAIFLIGLLTENPSS